MSAAGPYIYTSDGEPSGYFYGPHVSELFACNDCGAIFDVEGRYRDGYEPGETEFVPESEECPRCTSTEIEPV